jgi:hypothetical protein
LSTNPTRIPARAVAGDQFIAGTQDADGHIQNHVRLAGGAGPANETGSLTAAQPTPGTPVAGGTVGGAADYSSVGNVTVAVFGAAHAGFTVVMEASPDGGTTWFSMSAQDEVTNTSVKDPAIATNASRLFSLSLFGLNRFRARASTRTSGTLSVVIAPGSFLIEPVVASVASNPAGATLLALETVPAGVGQATVTDALISLSGHRDVTTAVGAASAFTVPVGKTFRVLGFTAWARNGAATATVMQVRLRVNKTGAAVVTSPIAATLLMPLANTVGASNRDAFFPSSSFVELQSGWGFAVTAVLGVASAASIVGVSLYGIEY